MILLGLGIGAFLLGFFIRGWIPSERLDLLKNEMREAEVITKIETERLKQHRMIDERMQ